MPNEPPELRTAAGREVAITEHEKRLDGLDARMTKMEGKDERRDKRWEFGFRLVSGVLAGVAIAIITALVGSGAVHP